jgi:hypothetical protein
MFGLDANERAIEDYCIMHIALEHIRVYIIQRRDGVGDYSVDALEPSDLLLPEVAKTPNIFALNKDEQV